MQNEINFKANNYPVIRNAYTATPSTGEDNTQPSVTIPDQTLSLKELLARHARGIETNSSLGTPIYNGDVVNNTYLRSLSRIDMLEAAKAQAKQVEAMRAKIQAQNEARKKHIEAQRKANEQQQQKTD